MHFAWTFSSQPPQKHIDPNTKYDIRWYIVQPISKHIPTPSLVSLSDLSIVFYWMSIFSLESHLTGEPCDYFILSLIVARNYVLACMFCIVWCQLISIWNKQIESSIYLIKQVWFFLNLMIREGAGNTENQDLKLRNRGTQWFIS